MKPTIVIVGRPNVGKSTLFNRLTRSRDAIVANVPGLTRDRHYGRGRVGGKPYIIVDTGGFEPVAPDGILRAMAQQTMQAVVEADAVIFMVDGRHGLMSHDREIAAQLRASGQRIWLVVNKTEGMGHAVASAEFHELALGEPLAISAAHGEGISDLADLILADFSVTEDSEEQSKHPRIAIVGRPNVGKSTLVNCLLGEDRVIVFDEPGTTRDAIEIEFERQGQRYTLIDTAGLRRPGRVTDTVEKFSVVKTLQAIEDTNVVILVLDASERITDQDAHIAGYIVEAGRALVLAVNKWDYLDMTQREWAKRTLERILNFVEFAPVHFISALKGTGIQPLFNSVERAYQSATARLSTPKLTRALATAVARQAPPRTGVSRPKPRYAHQGGVNPPRIVIHGTGLDRIADGYRRYLERFFRDTFKLKGTPLRVEFRQGANPFDRKRRPKR